MIRVAINGFGRIGRCFLRAWFKRPLDIEVVAINDLSDISANAHLLRFDTTFGKLPFPVTTSENQLVVGDSKIEVFKCANPSELPWSGLNVDVVVESTGRFTSRELAKAHLEAGAKRVVISAPADDVDATFVFGVNEDKFDPTKHFVVSNASCTTNCFVPLVKVLEDSFGIKAGLMTTVHAMTNDQNLLDLIHKDLRRARSAPFNIVPTKTGAAKATKLVYEPAGSKLDGLAIRVPVNDGSITDLTAVLEASVDKDEVNQAYLEASTNGPLSRVLEYSSDELVSSDIIGNPASCVFDSKLTLSVPFDTKSSLVKVFGWYDNEWGYSNRLLDIVNLVGSAG